MGFKRFTILIVILALFVFDCKVVTSKENISEGEPADKEKLDVEIKVDYIPDVELERLPLNTKDDINEVISSYMETEINKLLFKSFPIQPEEKAFCLSSLQVASPYLGELIRGSIATFYPNIKGVVKRWKLVIIDHRHREIKEYSGSGKPPQTIVWDGRNDEGEIIVNVGNIYSYVFTCVDAVGRVQQFMGEPFSFKGLIHREDKGLVISLATEELFSMLDDKVNIRAEALSLLREAADEIRKNHSNVPIIVEAYGMDISLLEEQAKAVAKALADELIILEERIKISAYHAPRYEERIDIVINR
jgi:hypothetical protein